MDTNHPGTGFNYQLSDDYLTLNVGKSISNGLYGRLRVSTVLVCPTLPLTLSRANGLWRLGGDAVASSVSRNDKRRVRTDVFVGKHKFT